MPAGLTPALAASVLKNLASRSWPASSTRLSVTIRSASGLLSSTSSMEMAVSAPIFSGVRFTLL